MVRIAAAVLFVGLGLIVDPAIAAGARKPNVVFFMVDDMGWVDCEPYGSQYYETPNMARFAERSMRFTDAYACPLCSPTRASIMTGKYSARHGITSATGHQPPQPEGHNFMPDSAAANRPVILPESKNYMEPSEYTLAEALRDAGYRTAHFGKWHLGLAEQYWPEAQGFQTALRGWPDPGPASYFAPGYYKNQNFPDGPPGEYITDRLTTEILKYIDANRDAPFFVNFWLPSVHGPWGFKQEYAERFKAKRDPRGQQGNPIMAAMLQSVDEALGRIVAKLDELKLADDTIFIFFSDNGGNTHSNTPEDPKWRSRDTKHPSYAGMMLWKQWAGDLPPTNNTPLRDGKGSLFEGGTRVPLMVAWPEHIKAGAVCDEAVCAIDMYPTILDLLGIAKKSEQKIDGISFASALRQSGKLERDALFTFFPHGGPSRPPGVSVRSGDWKLIRWFETSPYFPEALELYNLRDDQSESRNLARQMPERVTKLNAMIDAFLADTKALVPQPNPKYRPTTVTAAEKKQGKEPRYDGWVSRFKSAEMHDGELVVAGGGKGSFLGISGLKQRGPATVRLRTKSTNGGSGKVQWRTEDQDEFPSKGQVTEFTLPAGSDWRDTSVVLPTQGTVVHLRVYLPAEQAPVEVDAIELGSRGERSQRWEFQ
ncbi:MAG TPA: sulfatase [Pirellulales bacterium]|nr:sulfatase [Pirellulales bacterium]